MNNLGYPQVSLIIPAFNEAANLASLLLKSDQAKRPVVDELVTEVRGLREEIALLRQGQG